MIGRFNKEFVRAGLFDAAFTRTLTRLFEDRQLGDYDATAEIGPAQAARDITDAQALIDAVRAYLGRADIEQGS